ncbi:MAG: hypothetical protein Q9195_007881 [Heterodermia aff. obscurata]
MAASLQLLHLPLELLWTITDELSPHELRALRLVCRKLDQMVFDLVGPKDFAHVKVDLYPTRLQRLDGISKTVHVNRCVKRLTLLTGGYSEEHLRDLETKKIVKNICCENPLSNLEILYMGLTELTPKLLDDLLFWNSGSLRTIHFGGTLLQNGGKWTSVFAGMVGEFPNLQTVKVENLYEFDDPCNGLPLLFPGFVNYPIEPVSETYHNYIKSHYTDRRRLENLENAVQIQINTTSWRSGILGDDVWKVVYSGPDIDQFLLVLVDTAETR